MPTRQPARRRRYFKLTHYPVLDAEAELKENDGLEFGKIQGFDTTLVRLFFNSQWS